MKKALEIRPFFVSIILIVALGGVFVYDVDP